MYFKCEKVKDYFLEHGFVYTVRRHRYRCGADRAIDKNNKYLGKIYIKEISRLDLIGQLEPYVKYSGFINLADWIKEIFKLHKSDTFREFYLYRVDLLEAKMSSM